MISVDSQSSTFESNYVNFFSLPLSDHGLTKMVPGIPIRDCAASPNNCVPRRLKLTVIGVTLKTLFERSYLVPGLGPFELRVNCPCAPTSPPLNIDYFSISVNFFPDLPSNKWQGTLAENRSAIK